MLKDPITNKKKPQHERGRGGGGRLTIAQRQFIEGSLGGGYVSRHGHILTMTYSMPPTLER
jgi:hypothetical protein